MLQLLNPAWLWGFMGLTIPIAVHLLSRKEGKVIRFGSIRHLQTSTTAQFRSVRLNEFLLLVLRCALLTWIVFFLSDPHLTLPNDTPARWLVIEKGLEKADGLKNVIDSLTQKGYEVHALETGFPLLDNASTPQPTNYWALAEALNAKGLDDVVVLSYSYANHFKGERVATAGNLHWITYPSPTDSLLVEAIQNDHSVVHRVAHSSPSLTHYTTGQYPSLQPQTSIKLPGIKDSLRITPPDTVVINLISDAHYASSADIIRACVKAIQAITSHKVVLHDIPTQTWTKIKGSGEWFITLTDSARPVGQRSIALKHCTNKYLPLLIPGPEATFACGDTKNFAWVLTQPPTRETALDHSLTLRLADILLPHPRVDTPAQSDKRVLPEELQWTSDQVNQKFAAEQSKPLAPYLALLIFLTMAGERVLAYKRNQ